jgi:hypothetical protein
MWRLWRKLCPSEPRSRARDLVTPPRPAFEANRARAAQAACMLRFSVGEFYADIEAYGPRHFLCEVFMEGEKSPLVIDQAPDLDKAQRLARFHLEAIVNTELLWAARGKKGPAVARSEELMREAFETLSQVVEES